MQLSKLTFSLASLVVILAFVAMPAMAHVIKDDTIHVVATTHAAHPILKSVSAPEWVNAEEFEVTLVFEAESEADKITVPEDALTSDDISIPGFSVVLDGYPNVLPGASRTTQILTGTIDANSPLVPSFRGSNGYELTFIPAVPTTVGVDDPVRPMVMFDNTDPGYKIKVDPDADFTLAPERTDALSGPFTVLVSVTGQGADSSPITEVKISISSGEATLDLKADPGHCDVLK